MSSSCFLSIVIPVYNASKDILHCLESIWSQHLPLECYEVVCVDDCSTDNSCQVIERERVQHPNLRLVRNETNRRAGGARNHGIQEARGEYVLFIDADDYFHPEALKKVLQYLDQHPVDILVCQYIRELEGSYGTIPLHIYSNDGTYTPEEYRMHHGFIPYGPCQWIFKRELMTKNKIWFAEHVCAEDVDWTHHLANVAHTLRCVPVILMHYILTKCSQTAVSAHSASTAYHALMASKRLLTIEELWQYPENKQYVRQVAGTYATAGIKSFLFFKDTVKNKESYLRCYLSDALPLSFPWKVARHYPAVYSLVTSILRPLACLLFRIRSHFKYRGVKL